MRDHGKVKRRTGDPEGPVDPGDAADYLAELLPSLAGIAGRAGLGELAFILEMAVIEAATRRGDPAQSG